MRINVGAGHTRHDGFVNCDYSDICKPDYIFDIEKDVWPFDDNSVDEVIAHHVLEHLGEGYFHALKEMYRVCSDGAIIHVQVPHHRSESFFHDATHRRPITLYGLRMFSKKQNLHDIEHGNATSPLGLQIGVDFEVINHNLILNHLHPLYSNLCGLTVDEVAKYAFDKMDVYSELHVDLRVNK